MDKQEKKRKRWTRWQECERQGDGEENEDEYGCLGD